MLHEAEDKIGGIAMEYFKDLFSEPGCQDPPLRAALLQHIPSVISEDLNKKLTLPFTQEEVEKAVFNMGKDKAPGLDGFPPCFFQEFWEIIKEDLMLTLNEFWSKRTILKEWQATFLALIPKKEGVEVMEDFRPISLCNVKYKILSKVLANRLRETLPGIISPNQDGFVKGRQITDDIIIVHETLHSTLHRKEAGMIIKTDMSKAYDRVAWDCLLDCLEAFGFGKVWRDWMRCCVSSVSFSVLINGRSTPFFRGSRGLRQGDPLSPFLFIIMAEMLGRATLEAQRMGMLSGLRATSNLDKIVLHQFVDDNIFLCRASLAEARALKSSLQAYQKATNQKINLDKSLAFFINTPEGQQRRISRILAMARGALPSSYLGMPLFVGKMRQSLWDPVVSRFNKKLAGWKGALLSWAGKIQLVVASLQSIHVYQMSVFKMPSKVIATLEGIMKRFLWSGSEDRRRFHLVSWEKVCKPKWAGGLSVRRLGFFNEALLAKLGWRLTTDADAVWGRILARKYMGDNHFLLEEGHCLIGSSIWKAIRSSRSILHEGMRWKLGDGESIKFWEDRWCGQSILEELPNIGDLRRECVARFGPMVKDYMEGLGRDRRWRSLEDLQGFEDGIQRVREILRTQYIPKRPGPDTLVWPASAAGSYSVKEGYNFRLSREGWVKNDILAGVWRLGILPKIAAFWWSTLR